MFENEQLMYEQHTVSGHGDLAARASTAQFADIALGHHRWYDGSDGYPAHYVRTDSPYRQMTDAAACAAVLAAAWQARPSEEGPSSGGAIGVRSAHPAEEGPSSGGAVGIHDSLDEAVKKIQDGAGRQFSPMAAACLSDPEVIKKIRLTLETNEEEYYKEVWEQMQGIR